MIAAVCAAGVPANEDTACSPFCYHEELTGDELVRVAREKARSRDMLNVGPGADWSAGMQVGPVSKACKNGTDEDACFTFICHNPAAGCSSYFDADNHLVIAPGSTAIKAVRHKCSDGNEMLALTYWLSDERAYYYYEWLRPILNGRHKSEAGEYKRENGKMRRKRLSGNGKSVPLTSSGTYAEPYNPQGTLTSQSISAAEAQYTESCDCDSNNRYPGGYGCADLDVSCLLAECGLCNLFGVITVQPEAVLACILATCPYVAFSTSMAGCCAESGDVCFECETSTT